MPKGNLTKPPCAVKSFITTKGDGEILVWPLHKPSTMATGNNLCVVGAVGVIDNNIITPKQGIKATWEVVLLVTGENQNREHYYN
jgi:hypothetical protein